jgi:hypothetical protein
MRQVDGELQELKRSEMRQARRKQGTARTLEQLLALANERGYSPGWAYRIFHARGKR